MKATDINEHYSKHLDLYHEAITPEHMLGATPAPDYLILETIPPAPENLSSVNKRGLVLSGSTNKRDPIVFKILAVGSNCVDLYKEGDLVLLSFLAGDRFSNSPIVLCQKEDIILKWGPGIHKPEQQNVQLSEDPENPGAFRGVISFK